MFQALGILLLPLAIILECPLETKKEVDYQKMANDARWANFNVAQDFAGCVANELEKYDIEVVRKKGKRYDLTIRILQKGHELFSWNGHIETVFIESGGVLYYADYEPRIAGCTIVAYNLKTGKQLWKHQLKGIGVISPSVYFNTVRMQRVDGKVIAVYGKEAYGRYVEFIDVQSGKTVGHKIFASDAQPK